jgi:hypothetical protein
MIFFAQCDISKVDLIRNECVMPLVIKIRSKIVNHFQYIYIYIYIYIHQATS